MSGRRALLSLAGVAVSCAAVISLLTIGQNLEAEAMSVLRKMGSDLLVANTQFPTGKHTQAAGGIATLNTGTMRESIPEIFAAAPIVSSILDARFKGRSSNVSLVGTNSQLLNVLDLKIMQGRYLSLLDTRSTHVVVGFNLAEQWKQAGIPIGIGDQIAISGYFFQVIGTLQRSGENPLVPLVVDDSILMSMEGMRRVVGSPHVNFVLVRSAGGDNSSRIAAQLQQWLEWQMPHYTIVVQIPQQLIEGMSRQSRLFSWLLAGVGGIALLVGGIGIMNVMVMSVTERRREIGVRMALGARPKDIARLFLLESVLLAVTGAVIGAALGVIGAWVFVLFSGWSSFSLSKSAVMLGVGSAVLSGLFFGLSPAMAAARLTPTQALRDE